MKMTGYWAVLRFGLLLLAASTGACAGRSAPAPLSRTIRDTPRNYIAAARVEPLTIDGKLDDGAWKRAAWSEYFTDIEGPIRTAPAFRTRVKMMWDNAYWYVAAEMEERDLWATIRTRDAVIFHDNDFEMFVDPSNTGHRYFEIEMNQFATVWDLFLPKPYSEGGHAVDGWNIDGLRIATSLRGTINHPGDRDRGWTVELAIPWAAFADSGRNVVPPRSGDQWRVNFSRVEWDVDTANASYHKRTDANGKALPEHNWVWSPQGVINMHVPAKWGYIKFAGRPLR